MLMDLDTLLYFQMGESKIFKTSCDVAFQTTAIQDVVRCEKTYLLTGFSKPRGVKSIEISEKFAE